MQVRSSVAGVKSIGRRVPLFLLKPLRVNDILVWLNAVLRVRHARSPQLLGRHMQLTQSQCKRAPAHLCVSAAAALMATAGAARRRFRIRQALLLHAVHRSSLAASRDVCARADKKKEWAKKGALDALSDAPMRWNPVTARAAFLPPSAAGGASDWRAVSVMPSLHALCLAGAVSCHSSACVTRTR